MIARILNFEVKLEKKEEYVKVVKNQVLPILKKQIGFLEILPFFPEKMKRRRRSTSACGRPRRMPSAMRERSIPGCLTS